MVSKIWIDVTHPAQLNFYKNTIIELSKKYSILVTTINRGKLKKIAEEELKGIENVQVICVGKHKGTKFSAILDANILRIFALFKLILKFKPSIAVGNGILHPVIGKMRKISVIAFDDDIERSFTYKVKKTFSDELYYAIGSDTKRPEVKTFNSLKEWSYLSPDYFSPQKTALVPYSLKPFEYIFVREVITGTLNYSGQSQSIIGEVSHAFPKNVKVVLSLEDKTQKKLYPSNWILLQEPINDIHSLIYYSKVLVSSGDSMAREGAMLGTPSLYCGIREMNANTILINKEMLFHTLQEKVVNKVLELNTSFNLNKKNEFRIKLKEEWVDTTSFVIERIENNLKK